MRTVSNLSDLNLLKIGEIVLFEKSLKEARKDAFLIVENEIFYGKDHSLISEQLGNLNLKDLRKARFFENDFNENVKFAAGHVLKDMAVLDLITIFNYSVSDAVNLLWREGFNGIFLQSVKNKKILEKVW